jgi:hypothetical protein
MGAIRANRARETGKLVQARLDEARLPMPFDQTQCADLRGWSGKPQQAGWRSVLGSVAALVATDPSAAPGGTPPRVSTPRVGRRQVMLAGGAAAVLGAGGFAALRSLDKPAMSPRAEMLLERGMAALQDNDALDPQGLGSTMQAITLLSEAAEAAPDSAATWGPLAMAYAVRKRVAPVAEREGLEMRARAAAAKALKIDPGEPRALGALRLVEPLYRNWSAAERGHREALARNAEVPILIFVLSDLLGSVGRWKEAAKVSAQFDQGKFLIPGANRKVIVNLWASGDLQGADSTLAAAVRQWPQHPQIWRTQLDYLMYTGRPGEALELLREGAERPAVVTSDYVEAVRKTAEALAGRVPPAAAIGQLRDYLRNTPTAALRVAEACAALGDAGSAFAIFDGYYFGEGEWARVTPPNGDEDRLTSTLFHPPLRRLWTDARFDRLVERIGLENYWRQSGTLPDYRRGV